MNNQKNYARPVDIWDAEAKTSFVKTTTDWFSESKYNSRLHLSFVEHDGQKPKPKQVKAIEIGVPMVKAGSDGAGETGITALSLANAITTGALAKKAMLSRQKAQQAGRRYGEEIYACIGGTPASRAKDGVAEFRKFSIAPGAKEGTYALKAARCEGEDSATGGVQPKRGAQWTTILLPVSESYMRTLGENIKAEWTAFLTAKRLAQFVKPEPAQNAAPVQPTQPQAQPAATDQPAKKPEEPTAPVIAFMIYDTNQMFNGGLPVVTTSKDKAISIMQDMIRKLRDHANNYVANTENYNGAVELCNSARKGSGAIVLTSKKNPADKVGLVLVIDFLQ